MSEEKELTPIQRAAKDALSVQDACNLYGVIHAFLNVMDVLWNEAHRFGKSTDWVNQHPVAKMFANKVVHLTKIGDDVMLNCMHDCEELEKGNEIKYYTED